MRVVSIKSMMLNRESMMTTIDCGLPEKEKSKCKKLFMNSEISNSKSLLCHI